MNVITDKSTNDIIFILHLCLIKHLLLYMCIVLVIRLDLYQNYTYLFI